MEVVLCFCCWSCVAASPILSLEPRVLSCFLDFGFREAFEVRPCNCKHNADSTGCDRLRWSDTPKEHEIGKWFLQLAPRVRHSTA